MIEGVGPPLTAAQLSAAGGDGRYRFCTFAPAYAAAEPAGLWQPLLTEFPAVLAERADPVGGSTELGNLDFSLLDEADLLTGLFRTERAPTTILTVGTDDSATLLFVASSSGIAADTVVWLGDEACRVSATGVGTLTVERGYLGTRPGPHEINDGVFQSTTIIESRRVVLYLAPLDADSFADAREVGTYVIDGFSISDDANVWEFTAHTQALALSKLIPFVRRQVEITRVHEGADDGVGYVRFGFGPDVPATTDQLRSLVDLRLWTDTPELFSLVVEGEVIDWAVDGVISTAAFALQRDVLQAGKRTSLQAGQLARQVFLARSDFRFSPGPTPSTSRSSGTWTISSHWIDLLLIMLTSSNEPADGLELANYVSAQGNYSSLPPGYGVGLLADLIDWGSFAAVKQRTLDYLFPNFALGAGDAVPFGELIDEQFLKPMGAYLSMVGGEARIVLPRIPLLESSSLTLGPSDILAKPIGEGAFLPRARIARRQGSAASSFAYLIGPRGTSVPITNGLFKDTLGQRNLFSQRGQPIEIPVPGADPTQVEIWQSRGISRLFLAHRPRLELEASLDPGVAWDWGVGQLAALTLAELPNMRDATRGWSSFQCQLFERNVVAEGVADGLADGVVIDAQATAYGPEARVGRIAPAAICTGGGGFVWTFNANRYTQPDAVDGLPTQDVAAFTIGDVCQLVDQAGVVNVAGGTETVVDVLPGTNELEFTGDFNGELGVGSIVVFAPAANCTSNQRARYAFMADRATQSIAGVSDAVFIYGEA